MVEGVDYAFSWPDPVQLYAAGKRFAMRYIGDGTDDKHLHADERDQIWAAGLSICLLCEGTAAEALAGYAKGREQALQSLADMRELGVPGNVPVFFAADTDLVTGGQFAAIGEFCRGAADVMGAERVGMYGEYDLMVWLSQHSPHCRWYFQTYAWSGQKWFAGNHVEQYRNGVAMAGGTVDLCRAKTDYFGQWTKGDTMASEWHEGDEGGPFLTQGNEGYAGHQRDTALAFAWEAAHNAARDAAAALALAQQILDKLNAGGGGGGTGPVDLTDTAVAKVAETTVDELKVRL